MNCLRHENQLRRMSVLSRSSASTVAIVGSSLFICSPSTLSVLAHKKLIAASFFRPT